MSIYVEILIQAPMDDVWRRTQTPALHERWDLRFTSITYLPRDLETEPQRFLYSTRIGFGLSVRGEGETAGSRDDSLGRRTSSLRFSSDDAKSLIREGAGYWQYIPVDGGIRFITGYDYRVRFGRAGRLFDRFVFRPLIGWATAWSFDRLRLWLEKGIDPAISLQHWLIHFASRATIAFVWIYQGLAPKLITRNADELQMLADAGISREFVPGVLSAVGWVEMLFGVCVLMSFRRRWPLVATIILMVVATIGVAVSSPVYLTAAFNPVSLNTLMAVMSMIGLAVMGDLPRAGSCLRKEGRKV